MAQLNENTFHDVWGTGGAAAAPDESGTRVLDPKAFDSTWLKSAPTETAKEDTNTVTSAINAATGGAIGGIPIVGPSIKSGTEKVAAKIRSMMHGTPYDAELEAVRNYNKQSAEAHPVANTVGEVTGAVAPMLTGAGLAPRAFGLVGSTAERMLFGGASNALINGADTAARGGTTDEIAKSAGTGAGFGLAVPAAGKALGYVGNKLLSPPVDAATNRLIQRADDLGIPLRPAQISTSPFVNKVDQMVAKIPGSGMGKLVDEQHVGLNRAITKTFGEDADHITTDVMAAAKKRIGSEFDAVERGTKVQFDKPLISKLDTIVKDASDVLEPGQVTPLAKRIGSIIDLAKNGEFDGKTFNNMMKKGSPLDRLQSSVDPNVKYYAGQIRTALQDALERSAPPDLAQRYNQARLQYKNMKTIEPLAAKAATGDVSPLLLLNEVRKANPNFAYGSGGDLADIARIGQRFMRQPPDSGTPLGNKVLDLFVKGGAGVAAGAAGTAAYHYSDNPIRDTGIGLGALLAAGAGARGATTLLNRPQVANRLLQTIPAAVPAYNQNQLLGPPR